MKVDFQVAGQVLQKKDIAQELLHGLKTQGPSAPLLKLDNADISCNDIINAWQQAFAGTENELGHGVFPDEPPITKKLIIEIEQNRYFINTKKGMAPIERIYMLVEVTRRNRLIPISHSFRYSSMEGDIIEGVEFDTRTQVGVVSLTREQSGGIKVTLTPYGSLGT